MAKDYTQHEQALVHPGARIGKETRVWAFANVQDGAVIGESCNVADGCFVEGGAVVGNHVTLKNNVMLFNGVTVDDDVFIGAHTVFVNDRNPRSHRSDDWALEKTRVSRGATIGTNCTVMCGLTIGTYAFIGAGSVVTKDVPPYRLVCGNPAKEVGFVCQCGRKLMEPDLSCSCGKQYTLTEEGIRENV